MKKFCVVPSVGAFTLLALTACRSTDGDGYSGESALPVSEIAEGEVPWWLQDAEDDTQVSAGSHTPALADRNDFPVPEPGETGSGSASTGQNQPKIADADTPTVETGSAGGVDPLNPPPPTGSSGAQTATGGGSDASPHIASVSGKTTGKHGRKKPVKPKKRSNVPKEPTLGIYKVRPGDNLSTIAKLSRTTVAQIRRDSNLRSDVIHPGQIIKVRFTPKGYKPAKGYKPGKSSDKKTGTKGTRTHTITANQTISGIAQKYGISTSKLMKANGLNDASAKRIRPGRKLVIPR